MQVKDIVLLDFSVSKWVVKMISDPVEHHFVLDPTGTERA